MQVSLAAKVLTSEMIREKKNKEGMKVTREKKERKKGEQQEKRKERGREIMKGMRDTWRPLSLL